MTRPGITQLRIWRLDNFKMARKRKTEIPEASEAKEQEALFEWARLNEGKYPELVLLHHIPNGGWRHKAVAAALKRQGVKPGVPDLSLPVPRPGAHGLYIELKRRGSGASTSDAQDRFLAALRASGYEACVCQGWEQARDVIVGYFGRGKA